MSSHVAHLRIAGLLEQVSLACDFVVEEARKAGLDDHAVYHCELAVDEACTNIVEHGFRLRGDQRSIDVFCHTDAQRFIITLVDDAPPFNPLNQSDPDPYAPLDQRGSGGWGIHFIKQLMDETSYQYKDNRNQLTLVKFLTAANRT